jgi:acyl CoA:acetate/3-ketoacid CoA transferase
MSAVLTVTIRKTYREGIAMNTFQLGFDHMDQAKSAQKDIIDFYNEGGYSVSALIITEVKSHA